MAEQPRAAFTILRRPQVQAESGHSRSALYRLMSQGLWPRPVTIGTRAVGWPAAEVAALNAARIAGKSDDEIRAVVAQLMAERRLVDGGFTAAHVAAALA